jgi:SAM-dependent methyltransferase
MSETRTDTQVGTDFRNVVSGKIERNDPEYFLEREIDVYYRYNWALGIIIERAAGPIRVLELGCGLGWLGRVLERRFGQDVAYTGVDLDATAIEEATRRTGQSGKARFVQGDVCALSEVSGIEPGSFDFVIWFENLEHLHAANFLDLVDSVRDMLKPGGEILVEVPNRIGGGGLRATGPLRKSSGRYARGQHNPHHYFEPTLEEARFLFPNARIDGFDPGDHLLALKALAWAWSRVANVLLPAPTAHIDRGGEFESRQLRYMGTLRMFPAWNRAFLIRDRRQA